ncbi:MAG: DUF4878 domain-containing protein [Candidatus Coatesbacteria bacterium]|nr:DUF4878 domain-containing protein [Candidatus Coatesbacteria bacterium]
MIFLMNCLRKLSLILIILLLASSCGRRSPSRVVEKAAEYAKYGKLDEAAKFLCKEDREAYAVFKQKMDELKKRKPGMEQQYDLSLNVKSIAYFLTVEGERVYEDSSFVTLVYKKGTAQEEKKDVKLILEDDEWKIFLNVSRYSKLDYDF